MRVRVAPFPLYPPYWRRSLLGDYNGTDDGDGEAGDQTPKTKETQHAVRIEFAHGYIFRVTSSSTPGGQPPLERLSPRPP